MQDYKEVVTKFNNHVGHQDLDGLASLITDDHKFIDSAGAVFQGKQQALEVWGEFFKEFPDYKNIFEQFFIQDSTAIITGRSICSDKRLEGPAIWKAKLTGGKISEWRVYEDNKENRQILGLVQ